MVSSKVVGEFQTPAEKNNHRTYYILHHGQTKHAHTAFVRYVKSLVYVLGEMGTLFCVESNDLQVLDSRDLTIPVIITALRQTEVPG